MLSVKKILSRFRILGLALLIIITVSGCVGSRIGVSWAGLKTIGDDQKILFSYNDRLALIDPTNGSPMDVLDENGEIKRDDEGRPVSWEVLGQGGQQATSFFSTPVQYDDKTLLVATYEGTLLKIDLVGADIRRSATPLPTGSHIIGNLAMDENAVYLPLSEKNVAAIDPVDLTVIWTAPTDNGVWSHVLISDGVLYFGAMDHYLYAVNAATGDQLWKLDVGGALTSSPVLENGHLYIGSITRKVFEVSLDGEIVNEYDTEDWVWGTPVITDHTLYVADMAGFVYALDLADGFREIWKTQPATMGIRPSPIVTDDQVIVASREGKLYWLNRADGTTNLEEEIGAEILSDLLLIEPSETLNIPEPILVVSTVANDKLLVALTLDGGRRRWVYPS